MSRFRAIEVVNDRDTANRGCAALEEAGIPVMVEHVDAHEGQEDRFGFRVLVPEEHSLRARRLFHRLAVAHYEAEQ